jgi:outer membrane protein OmpA-like peptidoglycan-associated protein
MGNSETRATRPGGGREIALLVGVLLLVVAGMLATYWARSGGVEAAAEAAPEATAPARPFEAAPAPNPTEVVHADIYFDFKSTRLRAEGARLLQETAATLQPSAAWAVLVQGYADRHGPAAYNRVLAERRATTVKQFLVELGVPEDWIKVVTMGPEAALCDDPSPECQQLDRRVHLEIRRLPRSAAAEPERPALLVGDTLDTSVGGPGPR